MTPGRPRAQRGVAVADDTPDGPERRTRMLAVAALVVLCGFVVLLAGALGTVLRDRGAAERAVSVASDTTCYRLSSLEVAISSGRVAPEDIRRRVSDLALGAAGAREAVAGAARELADQVRSDEAPGVALTGTHAWIALSAECRRP